MQGFVFLSCMENKYTLWEIMQPILSKLNNEILLKINYIGCIMQLVGCIVQLDGYMMQ